MSTRRQDPDDEVIASPGAAAFDEDLFPSVRLDWYFLINKKI